MNFDIHQINQVKEIKELLKAHGRSDLGLGIVEKSELVEVCINFVTKNLPDLLSHKYDLVANITHTHHYMCRQ